MYSPPLKPPGTAGLWDDFDMVTIVTYISYKYVSLVPVDVPMARTLRKQKNWTSAEIGL